MSIETFWLGNLKRNWLLCFALNAFFAVGNISLVLVSSWWILQAIGAALNGACAVYSLYRWSKL